MRLRVKKAMLERGGIEKHRRKNIVPLIDRKACCFACTIPRRRDSTSQGSTSPSNSRCRLFLVQTWVMSVVVRRMRPKGGVAWAGTRTQWTETRGSAFTRDKCKRGTGKM